MDRTVKFRGLRVDGQGWAYGHLVVDPQGRYRIYWKPFEDCSSNTYHFVIPETVGQFTGLLDKNGVEIYRGDQLHCPGYLCTVIWLNGCFRTVYNHPEDGETLILGEDLDLSKMAVVGNIHEKEVVNG